MRSGLPSTVTSSLHSHPSEFIIPNNVKGKTLKEKLEGGAGMDSREFVLKETITRHDSSSRDKFVGQCVGKESSRSASGKLLKETNIYLGARRTIIT